MNNKMKNNIITIDNDEIVVRPSEEHEFLLDSKEVARGYGVSPEVIRTHKRSHADELLEGEHWISVGNPNANPRKGVAHVNTLWTKTGVATLGFFIKSERAKKFRRAAASLIVRETGAESPTTATAITMLTKIVDQLATVQGEMRSYNVHMHGRVESLEAAVAALQQSQPLPFPVMHNGAAAIQQGTTTWVLPRKGIHYLPRPATYPSTLSQIDPILFTPEGQDWWIGTATMLRDRLAKDGLHMVRLDLLTIARTNPKRCADMRSVARGSQRIYVLYRPGFTPTSLDHTLIRQEILNLIAA